MQVKRLNNTYASTYYEVTAEDGEVLTREKVEEKMGGPFGCYIVSLSDHKAFVQVYND
jgi:hypothetical protein